MQGIPVVVIREDGREEEFPSATNCAVELNISVSTVRKRLKNGEPLLWNGEKIRFKPRER